MIKNILIINLRRFGDIFSMAHLMASLKKNSPDCQISLLVYSEFKRAAKPLKNVDRLYTIDRKKLISLRQTGVFSDAFALEGFYESLTPVANVQWDVIVNYSNDTVSSYLTSFFHKHSPGAQLAGLRYVGGSNVVPANEWSLVFNDVITSFRNTPVHFTDCYHRMLDLNCSQAAELQDLISLQEHDLSAAENLKQIRGLKSPTGQPVKLLGLQLKTSAIDKNIPQDVLIDFINLLLDDPTLYPLLLIAPDQEERCFAEELNKLFKDALVVIEADFSALISVLKNVDYLITPDTVVKHVADIVGVPTLEISLGASPFLKQGSYREGNLVLSPAISKRKWFTKSQEESYQLSANDLMSALSLLMNPERREKLVLTDGLSLYKSVRDSLGVYYSPVAGCFNHHQEISRFVARSLIHTLTGMAPQLDEVPYRDHLLSWCSEEKNAILNLTKDILSNLRLLQRVRENINIGKEFTLSLERLLAHAETDFLTAIPTLMFRARLEGLSKASFSENIKEMEKHIYHLKDATQKILGLIRILEEQKLTLSQKGKMTTNTLKNQEGSYGTESSAS